MQPATSADKEAFKLKLRQQFGRAQMPYYIEQARKQFSEPNPPDWIFLYKSVDHGYQSLFVRSCLWQEGASRNLVDGCSSLGDNFEKAEEMTSAKDTVIAETFCGSLPSEDRDLLIQLAQQSCRENLITYLTCLKGRFKIMLKGPVNFPWVEVAVLRRRPLRVTNSYDVGAFLFLNHKLESALREAPRKIVDCERVEITVGDVI